MKRTIQFGSASITYKLSYRRRQRLTIRVHPDLTVSAVSPPGHSFNDVDSRVIWRAPWILRQIRSLAAMHPLPSRKRYVSGASHYLFGRELRLKVRKGEALVKVDRPYLRISVSRPDSEVTVATEVKRWYHDQAKTVLARRVGELAPKVLGAGTAMPRIRIRETKHRWGSCSPAGTLTFNPRLVEYSRGCIDYVVIHELCHLRHLDHGPRFEALLTRLLPEWKKWRAKLNNVQQ